MMEEKRFFCGCGEELKPKKDSFQTCPKCESNIYIDPSGRVHRKEKWQVETQRGRI